MTNRELILVLAKKIWDYHHVNHRLEKADCILALGSRDLRVAERAAQVYLESWAPMIVFSGGLGRLTKELWNKPEAEKFVEVAEKMGVPRHKMLVENQSTNTGENILFSKKLLLDKNINPNKFISVQKPCMERRTQATFQKLWPDKEHIVTSPQISFEEYPTDETPMDEVINIIVGDLQRIKIYPEKGFQIPQEIPHDVWDAYERLVTAGYIKHLIKE